MSPVATQPTIAVMSSRLPRAAVALLKRVEAVESLAATWNMRSCQTAISRQTSKSLEEELYSTERYVCVLRRKVILETAVMSVVE